MTNMPSGRTCPVVPRRPAAPEHPPRAQWRGLALLAGLVLLEPLPAVGQMQPPRPSADYAMLGRTQPGGGEIMIAHRQGRMRIEVSAEQAGSVVTGLLDLPSHRMTLLSGVAGMEGMAVEVDLPPKFRYLDLPADARFAGADMVATEPCGVWRVGEPGSSKSLEVCLTDDGIPLRMRGGPGGNGAGFEVTELERVQQDPARFVVPPGTSVTRIPRGMMKLFPSLME